MKYFVGLLLICYVIISNQVSAFTVYKKVNKDGTVVYSDKPFPGATKVNLPPINTRKTQPLPAPVISEKPPEREVASIAILSPNNGDSIRSNGGELTVTIGVTAPSDHNYKIQLLINDKPHGPAVVNNTFTLKELDRGIIKIKAQLQGRRGKVLATSSETVVYMHKASINRAR